MSKGDYAVAVDCDCVITFGQNATVMTTKKGDYKIDTRRVHQQRAFAPQSERVELGRDRTNTLVELRIRQLNALGLSVKQKPKRNFVWLG